jgi:hypothetical protein
LETVVLLNPVAGSQVYDVPPEAESVTAAPLQMATSTPAFAIGAGFTVTITVDDAVHPFAPVTITVYVVLVAGVATGLAAVALLSDAAGDHA